MTEECNEVIEIVLEESKYTTIDNIILRHLIRKSATINRGLNNIAVYCFIKSFSNNKNIPVLSLSEWAEYMGTSVNGFSEAINDLVDFKLLEIEIKTETKTTSNSPKEYITKYVLLTPPNSLIHHSSISQHKLYAIDNSIARKKTNKQQLTDDTAHATKPKTKLCSAPSAKQGGILEEYSYLAQKLIDAIVAYRRIKNDKVDGEWCSVFKHLVEKQKRTKEEISAVIDWYAKNIGGEYIPVVHGPKAFKEKYERLLDAIEREKQTRPRRAVFDIKQYEKDADYSEADEKAVIIYNMDEEENDWYRF